MVPQPLLGFTFQFAVFFCFLLSGQVGLLGFLFTLARLAEFDGSLRHQSLDVLGWVALSGFLTTTA